LSEKFERSKPAYETQFNVLRKKAVSKPGLVFSLLDPVIHTVGGDSPKPVYDNTDHLQFQCEKCSALVDMLDVRLDHHGRDYTLFLFLGCPKCGASGARKIYWNDMGRTPSEMDYLARKK